MVLKTMADDFCLGVLSTLANTKQAMVQVICKLNSDKFTRNLLELNSKELTLFSSD